MKRLLSILLALPALLVPAAVLAATPLQNTLDKAIQDWSARRPHALNIRVEGNVLTQYFRKTPDKPSHNLTFVISLDLQTFPTGTTSTDGEMRLTLQTLSGTTSDGTPISLTTPTVLEIKKIGSVVYLRLAEISLSETLQSWFEKNDLPTLDTFIAKWIRIEDASSSLVDAFDLKDVSWISPSLSQKDPSLNGMLRIQRVESRTTNAQGHVISRLRLTLHPQLLTNMRLADEKKVSKNDPDRAVRLRDIRDHYSKLRTTLSGLSLVAVLDETSGTLLRLEANNVARETVKETRLVGKTFRPVNVGTRVIHMRVGINQKNIESRSITPPDLKPDTRRIFLDDDLAFDALDVGR